MHAGEEKRTAKKLSLRRESLRELTTTELSKVAGGLIRPTSASCVSANCHTQ